MRKGIVFNTARAAAFASLGAWAGVLPVQIAIAAPPPIEHGTVGAPQGGSQSPVLAFLMEFWELAWDADFSVNESGMGLEPTTMPGLWNVTAYEQYQPIGSGSYDEVLRIQVPGSWNDELPPGGSAVFELYVTAGTIHGLGEYTAPAWGLVHHGEFTGDGTEPLIVEGFTPLGTTEDLATAVASATDLVDTFTQLWTLASFDYPPFTIMDPCFCNQIHGNEVEACDASAIACELLCTSIAVGAIAGCLAAGPFVAPCVLLVWAAHTICMASCLMTYKACKLHADNNFLKCQQLCSESITP